MIKIILFVPRKWLSYWVGRLMYWRGPVWWRKLSIYYFAKIYHVNLEEAERHWSDYPSVGEFFCRRLKEGLRPLHSSTVVHPADSVIAQCGSLVDHRLIQAKGFTYTSEQLTLDSDAAKKWKDGFFVTYYLCPTDYHRVHSPVEGEIKDVRHINGDLFPVNQWSAQNVPNLFGRNERVVIEIETGWGPVALVMVGATNVGSIVLSGDPEFATNEYRNLSRTGTEVLPFHSRLIGKSLQKGDEIGMFRMGSTVVMLYPHQYVSNLGWTASKFLNKRAQVRAGLL